MQEYTICCHRSPDVFSRVKMVKNVLAAGTLCRTPLGEITALPRPPSWTKGRGEWKRRAGEKERDK